MAMGFRGPVLKETWGHMTCSTGAVMDFVGSGMWRFLGVAQKGPFHHYSSSTYMLQLYNKFSTCNRVIQIVRVRPYPVNLALLVELGRFMGRLGTAVLVNLVPYSRVRYTRVRVAYLKI